MQLTEEQQQAVNHVKNSQENLVINAYAGTGKTSTLVEIAKTNPDKKFLYLAFNKAVEKEAKVKFPKNTTVSTIHALAYKHMGMDHWGITDLNYRLKEFWRNDEYAKYCQVDNVSGVKAKTVCFMARKIVDNYQNSADMEISAKHIDSEHKSKCYGDKVLTGYVVQLAKDIWDEKLDLESDFPIEHDTYLKLFQIKKPELKSWDIILLDEAQDTNPVTEDIVKNMNSQIILVGDTFQSIYGWRGAVDAIKNFSENNSCKKVWLTKSFRFGTSVSKLANKIIEVIDDKTPEIKGNSELDTVIDKVSEDNQYTCLFRTNAKLAREALDLIAEGKKVYIEGGVSDFCDDMMELFAILIKGKKPNKSKKYKKFWTIDQVYEESEVDPNIQADLNFLKEYKYAVPALIDKLKTSIKDKRSIKKVDVILSTVHKAKGLEWEQVKIFDDFWFDTGNETEWKVVYVGITRATKVLEIPTALEPGIAIFEAKKSGEFYLNKDKFGIKVTRFGEDDMPIAEELCLKY